MSMTRKQAQAMVAANERLVSMGVLTARDTTQDDAWSVDMMMRLRQKRLIKLQEYLALRRARRDKQ